MNRGRLLKTGILVAGVVGLAIAVKETISDAHGRVLPSPAALVIGEVLAFVTIVCACRTWTALFDDALDSNSKRLRLRSTFYLSQLTKYVPAAGGLVQVTSQVGMAAATGLPIGQVAVAFPTAGLSSVAAGSVIGAGLVFAGGLPVWARALAPLGLLVPLLLNRRVLAWFLGVARRFVKRIPASEKLPTQRSIVISFLWAVIAIGSAGASYAVLVRSLTPGANALILFCAYSLAWVIGFVALPIPAGIGIREAVLIAASLALRFLGLVAELTSAGVNRMLTRRRDARLPATGPSATENAEPARPEPSEA